MELSFWVFSETYLGFPFFRYSGAVSVGDVVSSQENRNLMSIEVHISVQPLFFYIPFIFSYPLRLCPKQHVKDSFKNVCAGSHTTQIQHFYLVM